VCTYVSDIHCGEEKPINSSNTVAILSVNDTINYTASSRIENVLFDTVFVFIFRLKFRDEKSMDNPFSPPETVLIEKQGVWDLCRS
jgi:hypothetical protein